MTWVSLPAAGRAVLVPGCRSFRLEMLQMVFATLLRRFKRVSPPPTGPGPSAGRHRRRPAPWLALEVLEARVQPSFVAPLSYDIGRSPSSIATAHLRGDGSLDLV